MEFQNQVVVITGGANGIGKGLASAYAEKGAAVVIADVSEEKGRQTAAELNEQYGTGLFVQTDVRKENDIVHLMEAAVHTYGRIDVLINNAGVSRWKSPYDLTIEEWDDVLNTNLRSVFLGSREAARYMKESGGGAIINIASTRAAMSEPNSEAYAATKGGILSLTHALAVSLGKDRITVNAISPGWIETNDYEELRSIDHTQHPSQRVGKPEDIAKACLYLSAKGNDFVTGINLVVDGGMTRKMIYEH
jgi:NAD(P)-dependent dehydrogenase (short-subunit alcohol dehydrogenase family)